MTEAHADRAHARLSPSGAHRWLSCPGSIKASEGIESKTSRFADEGTAAHTLADHCFRYKFDADSFIGSWIDVARGDVGLGKGEVAGLARAFEVTEEMAEAVQIYLDFVRSLCEGAEYETESKLDLRHINGMDFGTGDFSAFSEAGILTIVDFKYGKGVVVEVERNPQLMTYASGVMRRYQTRGIHGLALAVVQPRAPHKDGPVRVYNFDALDLMEFEEDLRDGAARALSDNAPRRAGEWCKFCPAAATCDENKRAAQAVATDVFGEMIDDFSRMTPLEVAERLGKAHMLKNWLRAFDEFAHAEAMAGRMPTGYKLVPKRATRKWSADIQNIEANMCAVGVFKADLYTAPELKSPAQVEPLIKGKNKKERAAALAPFVTSVSSGTNLVPLDDARAPARAALEDIFE